MNNGITKSATHDPGLGQSAPRLSKGERTRRHLLDAALRLLERDGYHDLKVTEVAREARVAVGVFYIYFKDKESLVLALFDELTEASMAEVYSGAHQSDAFEAILSANRRYIDRFVGNGGLNRALAQIVDALPEARGRWQAANARIAKRIAAGIAKRAPASAAHEDARFIAALALQAMLDTVLLQAFAYEFPEVERLRRNPDRLAEALSVLWFRALYASDPAPEQVPHASDFLSFTSKPQDAK